MRGSGAVLCHGVMARGFASSIFAIFLWMEKPGKEKDGRTVLFQKHD
jgi:hypothetical protein